MSSIGEKVTVGTSQEHTEDRANGGKCRGGRCCKGRKASLQGMGQKELADTKTCGNKSTREDIC